MWVGIQRNESDFSRNKKLNVKKQQLVLTMDSLSRRAEKVFDLNSVVLRKTCQYFYDFRMNQLLQTSKY